MSSTPAIHTSYIVCAIQRSGSFLLLESLKNTGLAGHPEEYFLNAEFERGSRNAEWAARYRQLKWGSADA